MTGSPRIVLAGFDGQCPLSDESVRETLIHGLREEFPDLRMTLAAAGGDRERRRMEVRTVPPSGGVPSVEALSATNILIDSFGRKMLSLGGFALEPALADGARGLGSTAGMTSAAALPDLPCNIVSVALGTTQPQGAHVAAGTIVVHHLPKYSRPEVHWHSSVAASASAALHSLRRMPRYTAVARLAGATHRRSRCVIVFPVGRTELPARAVAEGER